MCTLFVRVPLHVAIARGRTGKTGKLGRPWRPSKFFPPSSVRSGPVSEEGRFNRPIPSFKLVYMKVEDAVIGRSVGEQW